MGITAGSMGDDGSVSPSAIDLQGQSVNRQKYDGNPASVLSETRGYVAAAGVQVLNLPNHEVSQAGVVYLFRAHDLPTDDRPAHAEIRIEREGKGWSENYSPPKTNKAWLKELLASRLRIVYPASEEEDPSLAEIILPA